VIDAIESPEGKYPIIYGDIIVMEKQYVEEMLKEFFAVVLLNPVVTDILNTLEISTASIQDSINAFQLQDYSQLIVAMFKDRVDLYLKAVEAREQQFIRNTNQIALGLGLRYPASLSAPIEEALAASNYFGLLLQEIFFLVIGVLVILAILLIYSLLLTGVDEKTFEYGMLRTLGLPNKILVVMLSLQALCFSIPGIVSGLLLCFVIFVPTDFVISLFVNCAMNPTIQASAVALGLSLGLILPFFGMVCFSFSLFFFFFFSSSFLSFVRF
jgi:ABC-type antimicrobial peptide transport system permease subunit